MNVLDMTAIAINQGLISGWACGWELIGRSTGSSYIRFTLDTKGFMTADQWFGGAACPRVADPNNSFAHPVSSNQSE